MKSKRQAEILRIIEEVDVETQDQLLAELKLRGVTSTQATISRDIKELQLVKTLSSSGKYKYTSNVNNEAPISNRLSNIYRETVKNISWSGNIVLVKCISGCANAACEALDNMSIPHIIGSVAGDNTLLFVTDSPENSPIVVEMLNDMLTKNS